MSWLEGGTNRVLRADTDHHCDHIGVIFCTVCDAPHCAERKSPSSAWEKVTKRKKTPRNTDGD